MHSTRIRDDEGRRWVINHNGDWSGDVYVKRLEGSEERDIEKAVEEYTLPGEIIRNACAAGVVSDMIGLLEMWDGSSEAARRATDAFDGRSPRRGAKDGKDPKKEKVRITVDLTEPLYERLNQLEAVSGAASKADVVREALQLYEYLVKKSADGYEFSMQRDGEALQKILMFKTG